jgi:hypothetical protein
MKGWLTSLSWYGVVFIILSEIWLTFADIWFSLHPLSPMRTGVIEEPVYMWGLCFISMTLGQLFVLIGGLLARPSNLWQVLIITGIIYFLNAILLVTAIPIANPRPWMYTSLFQLSSSIACVLCLSEGLLIYLVTRDKNKSANIQNPKNQKSPEKQ